MPLDNTTTVVAEVFKVVERLGGCPSLCKKEEAAAGGDFSFICTGVCGHRIGKLTHPQTKAGPKTDPFLDYLQ